MSFGGDPRMHPDDHPTRREAELDDAGYLPPLPTDDREWWRNFVAERDREQQRQASTERGVAALALPGEGRNG